MKFFMVIIICMGADFCEAIYEQTPYESRQICQQEAATVRNYMIDAFPQSSGEIHCFTEEELSLYNEYLRYGGKPSLNPPVQGSDA
tara:strand:+ start:249 stop:506 length:258 start_codon:yes stop_codon:yes gene_type:complete